MPGGTIAEWLTDLGLAQYIEALERQQIGLDGRPDLTDSDHPQLGPPLRPRIIYHLSLG